WISQVCFHPAGTHLASSSNDHTVRLWDLSDVSRVRILRGANTDYFSVDYSPDGKLVAAGCLDGGVYGWDTGGDGPRREMGAWAWLDSRGAVFSPDGKWLAHALDDATIRVWRVADWTQHRVIKYGSGIIRELRFSPDGRTLAAAWHTGVVGLWDVASGAQ